MPRAITVGLFVLLHSFGATAGAQPPNHLACYRVQDPQQKAAYTADLTSLAARTGCKIKVPSALACVPATTANVVPAPPRSEGSAAPGTVVCYKARCPKATLPALQLDDEFGSRQVTPSVSKLLCAPVRPPTPEVEVGRGPPIVSARHLECLKVKDGQKKAAYKADVDGLVAALGCKIRVPATMTCVTTAATNLQHTPRGLTARLGAFGCYKLKCKRATLPALPVVDEFGSRSILPGAAKMLCAPAAAVAPTTTTTSTTSTTLPNCFLEPFTPVVGDVLAALAQQMDPSGDLAVPASCGATSPVCCPGGVPTSPCGPLHVTVDPGSATLTALGGAADSFEFGISMVATTVANLPVTIPLIGNCGIKIDTRAGAFSTIHLGLVVDLPPDHVRMSFRPGSLEITGLTTDDVSLTGSLGCQLANLGLGLFLDTLVGTVEDAVAFQDVCRACGGGVAPCGS